MKKWKLIFTLCLLVGIGNLFGQSEKTALHRLWEADSADISAIAMYPEGVREAILVAATQPHVLVRMNGLREDAAAEFRGIVDRYDRDDQEKLYELTRYPGVIEKLAERGKLSGTPLEAVLSEYPEEAWQDIKYCNRKLYPAVLEIYGLDLRIESANLEVLAPCAKEVQQAYAELVKYPEVMVILGDNLEMTILVGDVYKKDQAWVSRKLDSLSVELARQNAENLEAWKKEMEEDPQAMEDFQRAAEDYAVESGYSREEYAQPRTQVVYVDRYYYGYNYWYGYPYWYSYPVWYPRPWWQDWGYYYGPGGSVVFMGLPSWNFCHWYYHHPHHHYYYPNFTNFTVNYYYGHRKSPSSLASGVRKFENDTRQYFTKDWIKDKNNRKDLIKSYGEIELKYEQNVVSRPQQAISKPEFIRAEIKSNPKTKAYAAPVSRPATVKPAPKPRPGYVVPERSVIKAEPRKPTKPIYSKPRLEVNPRTPTKSQQIDRAKDFHKNTWTQPKQKAVARPGTTGKVIIKRR